MNTATTEHTVTINGTRLWLTVTGKAFRWNDGGEQCHDCGGDAFTLCFDGGAQARVPTYLRCDGCRSEHRISGANP
ncbi:MAG: hypothetical protein H0W72_16710 [Planctomycetes bacterium]|nr:hypothetical protein [Planctomycetota bacterium]